MAVASPLLSRTVSNKPSSPYLWASAYLMKTKPWVYLKAEEKNGGEKRIEEERDERRREKIEEEGESNKKDGNVRRRRD